MKFGRWELEDGSPKSEVGRLIGDNLGGLFVFDFVESSIFVGNLTGWI